MNYYNEIDPFSAAWLRELISAGHIAEGYVDERSIEIVKPEELREFTQCHFFAGIGVWSYALRQAGWPDDQPVWTGSCPCQPFSAAGRHEGSNDKRHLWPAWFWLIGECRPNTIFSEQVSSKDGLAWFDSVSSDLEGAGYTVGALDTCAAGVGAPHVRQRLYFVAHSPSNTDTLADSDTVRRSHRIVQADSRACDAQSATGNGCELGRTFWSDCEWLPCLDGKARPVKPGTFPLVNGTPNRVGRLRGYGNALCAPQAQAFIKAYLETLEK